MAFIGTSRRSQPLSPGIQDKMPQAAGLLAGRRILMVEDEYLIAEAMEGWLRGGGAEILGPVTSVDQALEIIEEEPGAADLAVLDVNLGRGETVYPVADRLDELGVPYLFATGDVRIKDAANYRQHPKLEKPILRQELILALEELLAASRNRVP